MKNPLSHRRGFTLVEILAVIAIIGILMAMTFGLYGYVNTSKKEARARGEIAALNAKLEDFKARYGDYPMAASRLGIGLGDAPCTTSLTGPLVLTKKTTVNGGKSALQWDASHLAVRATDKLRRRSSPSESSAPTSASPVPPSRSPSRPSLSTRGATPTATATAC